MVYKLDKINRRILYELDNNCRISDNQLAKKVNRSREAIRNRINKLVKDGVIEGFITSINPSKFGYSFFKLYLKVRPDPEERKRLFKYLKNLEGLYWYGTNEGIWDLQMAFYAKSVKDFNDIKNHIYTNFKNFIVERSTGTLVKTRQYPRKFLTNEENNELETYFAGDIENNKLDELNFDILNKIAMNARISLVNLANKCNTTVDIIRIRIKKLEEKKIIMQYRPSINLNKIGYIYFKSFLYFENLSEKDRFKLIEYSKKSKNITYLIEQLSSWDFEIELVAKTYQEFVDIMNEIRLMFKDSLRNYESCMILDDVWFFTEKKFI